MNENVLLIFTKNLVYGKVKTRLAATIGNDKALEIYKQLVQHTCSITQNTDADKIVYYDEAIVSNDVWKNNYEKRLQCGVDLGKKMMNAFKFAFEKNYEHVVIIGTDCAELTALIIDKAFKQLHKHDVVIGPAADGGYYLLAMTKMNEQLFVNIEWSTLTVLDETIQRCKENNLSYCLLDELHDVDEEKDLVYMKHIV